MTPLPRPTTRLDAAWALAIATLAAMALSGCATHPMMPAPLLYTGAQARSLITDAPAAWRTPPLDLLYITDRTRATGAGEPEPYTAGRARSMAFGSATVLFGEGLTWDTLVSQSVQVDRTPELDLKLGPTNELGRYPRIPYDVAVAPGGFTRASLAVEQHEAATRALQAEVARRLAASPRKEIVLYVHGYHNSFSDAALTMGELCHFLGREFVCAIFSWPAGGSRGVLFGYEEDYESSEYAVEHIKKAIRTISTTPGLEKIHLLAHSRGTAVLTSALAALSVEAYIDRDVIARRYKVGNVVLMAPDLDPDIARAKLYQIISDPGLAWGPAPDPHVVIEYPPGYHMTIYVSPHDKALATSSLLFGAVARLGQIGASTVTPEEVQEVRRLGYIDMIQFTGEAGLIGHSYFVSSPQVSSDIIAMIRYGLHPNEPGRPLEEIARPYWRIP